MAQSFSSIGAFIEHLAAKDVRMKLARGEGLERIGEHVAAKARAKIGVEQTSWDALAPATIEDKSARGYPVPAPLKRNGVLQGSIDHEVTGNKSVVGSWDEVAVYQELGTPSIPPRSFLASSVIESEEFIKKTTIEVALQAITGRK